MPQFIDISAVQDALFRVPAVRVRIERDYELAAGIDSPSAFASAIVDRLGQTPVPAPLEQNIPPSRVLEAATRAIGSNSRSWARFLRNEPALRDQLHRFDLHEAATAKASGHLSTSSIRPLLGGITGGSDAKAILDWVGLLARIDDYYSHIVRLGTAVRDFASSKAGGEISDAELMLCLVGLLARPPATIDFRLRASLLGFQGRVKLPGMGYALASEFFRNLGWSGFKPDRHVVRLFDRWQIRPTPAIEQRANLLASIVGSTQAGGPT